MKVVNFKRDDQGNQQLYGIQKESGTKAGQSHFWDKPIKFKTKEESTGLWRKVKRVIVHPDFKSGALLWKGGLQKKLHIYMYSIVITKYSKMFINIFKISYRK